jgi:kynurenine 3-monooxygenase
MSTSSSGQATKKISVLGAGLVGSLLSVSLAQKGYQVEVFEKRTDSRNAGYSQGRSINLALSHRGLKALEAIGFKDHIDSLAIPMKGRMMHDLEGQLTFQPYGKEGQAIYSVSRGKLNEMLVDFAEKHGVNIHFNHKCQQVDLPNATAMIETPEGKLREVRSDILIGADGAFSALRNEMMKTDRFNYSQFYLEHGYKELTIPPTAAGEFALEPNALHIWPRGQYMLIALPNLDKSFTCTLFFPFEGKSSFQSLKSPEQVMDFFQTTFSDAVPLMPTLIEDFFKNPTSSLITVRCYPWVRNEKNLILGDASHAIVPFYGQGMNAGFEDCRILGEMIDQYQGDWPLILQKFQQSRKPDADAISELALQNFIEMRDRVANPKFLIRKKIEARLHELYPEQWMPLYSMVTFSDMRYSEAFAAGKKQEQIMNEIMSMPDIEEKWETLDLESIVNKMNQTASIN